MIFVRHIVISKQMAYYMYILTKMFYTKKSEYKNYEDIVVKNTLDNDYKYTEGQPSACENFNKNYKSYNTIPHINNTYTYIIPNNDIYTNNNTLLYIIGWQENNNDLYDLINLYELQYFKHVLSEFEKIKNKDKNNYTLDDKNIVGLIGDAIGNIFLKKIIITRNKLRHQ